MSDLKYHTSKSGFLTKCTAKKRACPRGSQHYTESEYENLVAENDVRVRPNPSKITKDKAGYFATAEKAYAESVKRIGNFDKAFQVRKKRIAQLFRQNGLKQEEEKDYYENVEATKSNMLAYARKIYQEEGVDSGKAYWIIQDMENKADPSKPITKRRDSRDAQIAEKTKRAVARLKTDKEYKDLTEAYKAAEFKSAAAKSIHEQAQKEFSETIRNSRGTAYGSTNQKEIESYQKAKAWLAAKIPASAKEHHTSKVQPEMISVDKSGKINNAWVQHNDGSIERIVSYTAASQARENVPYRGSGALVTESGAQVNHGTHYHSYTSTDYGTSHIIIADKKGETHPAKAFTLQSYFDTTG